MYQVGVFNEGHSSLVVVGLSKECKRVFNKPCAMPWCHAVVDFEVKTSHFGAVFQDDRPDRGGTSPKQAVFLPW